MNLNIFIHSLIYFSLLLHYYYRCIVSQQGHLEVVEVLIASGGLVDKATNVDGITPLYIASQQGHIEMIKLLLSAGTWVNQAMDDGTTCFCQCEWSLSYL